MSYMENVAELLMHVRTVDSSPSTERLGMRLVPTCASAEAEPHLDYSATFGSDA